MVGTSCIVGVITLHNSWGVGDRISGFEVEVEVEVDNRQENENDCDDARTKECTGREGDLSQLQLT